MHALTTYITIRIYALHTHTHTQHSPPSLADVPCQGLISSGLASFHLLAAFQSCWRLSTASSLQHIPVGAIKGIHIGVLPASNTPHTTTERTTMISTSILSTLTELSWILLNKDIVNTNRFQQGYCFVLLL